MPFSKGRSFTEAFLPSQLWNASTFLFFFSFYVLFCFAFMWSVPILVIKDKARHQHKESYFFTIWMTSSCSIIWVKPTLWGLYFVLVPFKEKGGEGLGEDQRHTRRRISSAVKHLPTPRRIWTGWLMICEFDGTARQTDSTRGSSVTLLGKQLAQYPGIKNNLGLCPKL